MKKRMILDGYNNKISGCDAIGTVVPQNSRWHLTNGYKVIEIYEEDDDTKSRRQGHPDDGHNGD